MSDLFATLPEQRHPSARITWCSYPAPEGRHPAQDCLRWMGGSVDAPADCRKCEFFQKPAAKEPPRDG
jgi:hypothetical protein